MSGQTQPTLPLPEAASPASSPRRRRGWIGWLIAIVIVVGLAIVAWFVAEHITRDILTRTVREQVITQLALPEDQQVDVGFDEPVLPQVIGGRLDRLDVSSDAVPLGDVVADVSVRARDVPIRVDAGDIGSAEATITFGEDQLQTLLAQVEGVPEAGLTLVPPDVRVEADLSLFALTVPLGIDLTPSAVDGDIVLTPAVVRIGGAELTTEGLRDRFGSAADAVLRDYPICIRDRLPAGLTVREVRVERAALVAEVDVDGAIIRDPALQANGTCA
ncbi:LmeA family phospholipid-binding protein [Microbacterium radiodurans]|uniref:DUF2993 domain-containing protein n=1 Tax=Microbacterium radiodurans TaxID=661398 RepID=A0A5J5IUP9_9MICO|nr:DUF2993 domain-containing protein [Microbacterium radiodurans]KAA9089914.1 DUF2993 domain-containing protein [Microbacterium radiodurans]